MLDASQIGMAPDPAKIEKLIAEKKIDMERLLGNIVKRQ